MNMFLTDTHRRKSLNDVKASPLGDVAALFVRCSMALLALVSILLSTYATANEHGTCKPLVFGDSLNTSRGWVHLMDEQLKKEGFDCTVINLSITGETTHGQRT